MTFLEQYRSSRAGRQADDVRQSVVREWLTTRPDELFEELREHEPTFTTGGMAFVTRYRDVLDVLGRNDVFSVAPYGEAMTRINRGPNFLLGMDDGPEYRRELQLLTSAFRREDAGRVGAIVAQRTAEVLDAAMANGRLDLVDGFGRLVPALVIADYFGVPGPDPHTLARWARAIFADAFANALGTPLLSRRAMRASKAFRAHLDAHIARRRAERPGGALRDDVLDRLMAWQPPGERGLSDPRIRDILLWCVAGMVDNVDTAVCRVMDVLLDEPSHLREATAAARASDVDRVRAIAFEALRLCTATPVVTRRSRRAHIVARGTPHEKTIPAGTLTFVGIGAAMMDGSVVEDPKAFRLDRPPEHYLHFGVGLHQCLGTHIAAAHLTTMIGQLLRVPVLRRAPGLAGRLRSIGPFPKRFVVEVQSS